MTPDERLAQIEQRAAAATEGPWDDAEMRRWPGRWDVWDRPGRRCIAEVLWERDAEFIAHARADVPWLLSQLRDARAEIKGLTAERNIAVNTAVAKTPNFDVVTARIQCEQREAADRRAAAAEAELAAERAKVQRVEALCNSGVFDVREWGERRTPFSNGAERAFKRVRAALTGGEQG